MPEGGEQKRKKGKKSYHMKENRIEPKDIYSHFSVSFTLIDDFSLHYNLKDVNVSIFFIFLIFLFFFQSSITSIIYFGTSVLTSLEHTDETYFLDIWLVHLVFF